MAIELKAQDQMDTISSLFLPMDPAILLCSSSTANVPNKYGYIFSTDANDSKFDYLSLSVEIVFFMFGDYFFPAGSYLPVRNRYLEIMS